MLVGNVCSKLPIIIRPHDLHACNIIKVVGEIISYPFFLIPTGCASFGHFLAFPFCLPYDGFDHRSFIGFL